MSMNIMVNEWMLKKKNTLRRIWKRECDKVWTLGAEKKYLNLSTLMYDFIESFWCLILRTHMVTTWDNILHEKGRARIAMPYTLVLL